MALDIQKARMVMSHWCLSTTSLILSMAVIRSCARSSWAGVVVRVSCAQEYHVGGYGFLGWAALGRHIRDDDVEDTV